MLQNIIFSLLIIIKIIFENSQYFIYYNYDKYIFKSNPLRIRRFDLLILYNFIKFRTMTVSPWFGRQGEVLDINFNGNGALIEEVRKYPILYDQKHEKCSNV